ncbi:unnamed protein product, partial [Effrenium voratum]
MPVMRRDAGPWMCQQLGSDGEVLRFKIQQEPPDFVEAFEEHFGRPYDEEEAKAVFSEVGQGLKRLGYQAEPSFPTTRALALFFHVNDVKEFRIYPWCVGAFQALPLLSAAQPFPGQLGFFEAVQGRKRAADWRVEELTPGLAQRVLIWLGYEADLDLSEALQAFWHRNGKALRTNLKRSALRPPTEGPVPEKLAFLDAIFSSSIRQQWRAALVDTDLRPWLVRKKYLAAEASKAEAMAAMQRLLLDRGLQVPRRSYALTVSLVQECIMQRADPL